MTGLLIDIFKLRVTIRRLRNLGARLNLDIHLAFLGSCNGWQRVKAGAHAPLLFIVSALLFTQSKACNFLRLLRAKARKAGYFVLARNGCCRYQRILALRVLVRGS